MDFDKYTIPLNLSKLIELDFFFKVSLFVMLEFKVTNYDYVVIFCEKKLLYI